MLKIVLNHSLRFRRLLNNSIYFKRNFIFFDNKVTKISFNYRKDVLNVRQFCDKNKRFNETTLKKQSEKPLEIKGKKIPKTSEWFYIIVKKPNQLMEWVANTPPEKKKNVIFSAIIKYLILPMGYVSLIALVYILVHYQHNSITGRECMYSIPKQMAAEIENDILKEIFTENLKSGSFLPSSHPSVKRLDICFEKLIKSNSDLDVIGDGIWTPVIINDDKICDVLVLKETRHVFVYKKMVDLCQTEDELAYVLAHQLSHAILDHDREPMTYTSIFFLPFLAILPKVWLFGQDPVLRFDIFNKIDTFLENRIKEFVRKSLSFKPYTAQLEEETDRIAMQLMTRSCFDIRKCRQFCKKYRSLSQTDSHLKDNQNQRNNDTDNEFFRRHPITEEKLLYLFQYIKPFVELRKICDCQPLV